MVEILYTIFQNTFGFIISFLDDLLVYYNGMGVSDYNIKIGFGSVEWFDFNLQTLIVIVGTIIIGIIFIMLIWKVFKFFTKLVNRAFGGRKW